MKTIAAQAFAVLWQEHPGYYIITHDGCYHRSFCADSDVEAIRSTGWHIPEYAQEAAQ